MKKIIEELKSEKRKIYKLHKSNHISSIQFQERLGMLNWFIELLKERSIQH